MSADPSPNGDMTTCQNCGSHVSKQYARVFAPDENEGPRVCHSCPDKIRVNGRVRKARNARRELMDEPKFTREDLNDT